MVKKLRFKLNPSKKFSLKAFIFYSIISLFTLFVTSSNAQNKVNNLKRGVDISIQNNKIQKIESNHKTNNKSVKTVKSTNVLTPLRSTNNKSTKSFKTANKHNTNSSSSSVSNNNAKSSAMTYCIPVSDGHPQFYIDDFSTTGGSTNITNNGSGLSTAGYGDFTSLAVTQIPGGTVNFSGTFNGAGVFNDFGVNIWVDWNNDLDFSDLGEQVYGSGSYVTNINDSFVIPGTTPTGSYRMRILIDNYDTNPDSCFFNIGDRGEAEDYTLIVGSPPVCATPIAQPTALTFDTITSSTIAGTFTAASPTPDNYLIVINTTGITPVPVNATNYNIGDTIGAGNTVIDNDNNLVFSTSGLSITTTYHFFIFSYNNIACTGGPVYNGATPLTSSATTSNIGTYCEPESTNNEASLYIDDVEFIGTLNDVSNLNNGYSSVATIGYQDFSGLTNSIQAQGQGINVFLESQSYRGHIKAWVDWDLDGLFEETASELVYDTGFIATSSTTFGFIIPENQAVGEYRIRIKIYNSFNNFGTESYGYDFDSCEDFQNNGSYREYGETEDYTFTVIQSCDATIDSITEGANCGDGTVNLSVTGSPGTIQYNWYASDVAVTPLATTLTGDWITPSITTTTAYYVTADNGSCESLVRTKIIANIRPTTTLTFTPSVPEVCGEGDIIEVSATGSSEIAHLIDEDFEGSGLGSFTNNNIRSYSAAEDAITMWQQRTSTFVPSEQVWFPAISSGFGNNKFVMATSDAGTFNITENALESGTLDTSDFTDLTLSFDMYFSRYLYNALIPENVNIEVTTDGGLNWTTIQTYDNDVGYGTNMANLSFNLDTYVNENDFKVRIRYFADVWCDGVAIDNIELYGSRPITSSFAWTSPTTIDAYTDAAATIPYTPGSTVSTVFIKPTLTQLQQDTFSFVATATLTNGCDVSIDVDITNKTKYWTGATSTDWNDSSNWLPVGVPTALNCVIIPDQTIISGTGYDAYAKNIIINSTGDLELQSGNNLIVTEWIDVNTNGNFDIRNTASLVQIDNDANSGIVKIEKDSQAMFRLDYTYWSSPLTTASGYLLGDLSPNTPGGGNFYSWTPTVANGNGNWAYENPTSSVMTSGIGYAVRAPSTFSPDPSIKTIFNAVFEGTPTNGDVNIPVSIGTDANIGVFLGDTAVAADDDQWNLIGNPYPSAIDIISFLNDAGNATLLDGTAYLWTHNTAPSTSIPDPFYANFVANYTSNDYASVNSLGATNTAATGGQTPTQHIASGQGFFVLGIGNGTATFDNTMRVKNDNNNFFRTANSSNPSSSNTEFEKHRFWLNLSNNNGAFSQILVGYAEGATLGWDRGIDALSFGGNDVKFYFVTPDNNLTIQGKPLPFEVTDIVPLGFKAVNQGEYRIGIDHVDPLFTNQDIFLKDKDLNIVHDIKSSPYIFNTNEGTFDNRFEIVYTNNTLSVDDYLADDNSIKVISKDKLTVISNSKTIQSIQVFDILGRNLINYDNIEANTIELNGVEKGNRGLLLKIVFTDDTFLHKKALY
ncbi:GEVED domain-containing protein [uncultured Lacinutrix sp.]|uniref:GEVED domain-containing protein n=1 Tax=uncultured Lacinutrix sp. TaxID=574032 RepID=UPI002628BC79|nr:GEVED domain-containing protein [uncultured Lacinutrix sp.]